MSPICVVWELLNLAQDNIDFSGQESNAKQNCRSSMVSNLGFRVKLMKEQSFYGLRLQIALICPHTHAICTNNLLRNRLTIFKLISHPLSSLYSILHYSNLIWNSACSNFWLAETITTGILEPFIIWSDV